MPGSPRMWTPASGTFHRATGKKPWPGMRGCPRMESSRFTSHHGKLLQNGTKWRPGSVARSPPGATARCLGSEPCPPTDHGLAPSVADRCMINVGLLFKEQQQTHIHDP